MAKFNLKTYIKINGDEHIESRLDQDRGSIPKVIEEKQLEEGRVPESNVIMEKLLDKTRTQEATTVTELQLNNNDVALKDSSVTRDLSTFDGDINKIEEQRLANDPVEKEKYIDANETPKKLRWWEDTKSPDGLKLTKNDKEIKQAQLSLVDEEDIDEFEELRFDRPDRWTDLVDVWEEERNPTFKPFKGEDVDIEDFEIIDNPLQIDDFQANSTCNVLREFTKSLYFQGNRNVVVYGVDMSIALSQLAR